MPKINSNMTDNVANFKSVVTRTKNAYSTSPDFIAGLSEAAINKFLAAHLKKNPDFYDRSRKKGKPIFQYDSDLFESY